MIDQIRGSMYLLEELYEPRRRTLSLGDCDVTFIVTHGDGRRFADLLQRTWGRVPPGPRRLIRSNWMFAPPGIGGGADVLLLHGWPSRHERGYALVDLKGHRLQFHAGSVAEMSDGVVQDLIAHELAHVVQAGFEAVGCHAALRGGPPWDAHDLADVELFYGPDWIDDYCEWHADYQIQQWGFDPRSIDDWELATGLATREMLDAELRSRERAGQRWRRRLEMRVGRKREAIGHANE